MKKFEIIIAVVSVIALVLSFLLVPHTESFGLLILLIYSMFYWLFSFALLNNIPFRDILKKIAYKGIGWKRIVGAICTGYALSVMIIGIFFKFLFFPGAMIISIWGIVCFLVIAIISVIKYEKNHSPFYAGILKRIAIIGGIGIISLLLSSDMLIDIKYRNYPEYAKAMKDVRNNSCMETEKKLSEERIKMKYDGSEREEKLAELEEYHKLFD